MDRNDKSFVDKEIQRNVLTHFKDLSLDKKAKITRHDESDQPLRWTG